MICNCIYSIQTFNGYIKKRQLSVSFPYLVVFMLLDIWHQIPELFNMIQYLQRSLSLNYLWDLWYIISSNTYCMCKTFMLFLGPFIRIISSLQDLINVRFLWISILFMLLAKAFCKLKCLIFFNTKFFAYFVSIRTNYSYGIKKLRSFSVFPYIMSLGQLNCVLMSISFNNFVLFQCVLNLRICVVSYCFS